MLYSTLMLMMSSAFLMLRLSPGGSFPRPLSEAEERRYLEAWLQGDLEARNVLIERNLRLVAHIIKKYYTHYDDTDDLISIGTIGLIKGINTYRPDKGVRLATYASKCAENEILMYFRSTRKNAAETLLSDALDTDGDGNSLSLLDILSEDEDMDARLQSDEMCQALALHRRGTRCARARDHPPALCHWRRRTADAARDRAALRHQPLVCVAHREKSHRKAARRPAGGRLLTARR